MQLRKSPLKPTACSSSRDRWGDTCEAVAGDLEGLSEDIGEVDGGLQNGEDCKRAGVRRKEGRERGNNLKIARNQCFVCHILALPVLLAHAGAVGSR
jgi:hypothetical protein